jgi:hypothetical protein
MDGSAQSRLYQLCKIAGKVCLPAGYARLFRLSSHALKPGQSMSCLNMQAPQRWSFNIRVYTGASALTSFVSYQSWYFWVS